MKVQVIGVCRFSLLVDGGFQRGPTDLAARREFLFDRARRLVRFAWFEHVLLPAIRAQTSPDFRFVILASTELPRRWKQRLRNLVSDDPRLDLDFCAVGPHWRVTNTAMRRRYDPEADVIAQFRVDDDDAVATDYVARVHSDFEDCLRPLFDRFGIVSSDYVRGFILEADGRSLRTFRCQARTWNCGQTLYLRPEAQQLLFSYGHHRLHLDMPTVTFHDSDMFLRGRHGINDSEFKIPSADARRCDVEELAERFPVSIDNLQSVLSRLPRETAAAPA